ncbi:RuBisCO large subunit C-terminal-like domain-containing protein [Rhizobium sp. LC145]|uniref:RuBisCO large subunit C-terminal-like domain-containing protein n=1 Tax=Rhizobium sp. LC145 TaxID=1120688 RepID=UPI000629FB48|nr:RuBisCO large subunit C-terminal-like domain-containing protein [Rhizobium sp. LC145]KKX33316.1 ribulose 1,5-bisphosphate carboxylase [Rhizobium sp. LC145]TKT55802.1 ribulose 1,5-bisphosphate carboxylase [Rhizobiaceae bacterium LC148]
MTDTHFEADYLIETPLPLAKVADIMAGEQSCGTFTKVEGETDDLRARAGAEVIGIDDLGEVETPTLPSAWLHRRGVTNRPLRARIKLRFPIANIGVNLAALASTAAGNLYDLGEVTGLRLESITLPPSWRRQYAMPRQGIVGTRRLAGVTGRPMIGSIIKPNVGLSAAEIGRLVERLCNAGIDFIKDDEIAANPAHAPLSERITSVMAAVKRAEDKLGRRVMIAFNITDETDAMRRNADLVARQGGTCIMANLNWCGFSAVETLRRSTDLVLHGHRNGFGALSRCDVLGISFSAYQTLWRLAGVDHMHVHGLDGKFAQENGEVIESTALCLTPLDDQSDDRVLPAFSSGQWAGTVPATWKAVGGDDFLFMAGGGIMGHPGGPTEGIESIRAAFRAMREKQTLEDAAKTSQPLRKALDFFGKVA